MKRTRLLLLEPPFYRLYRADWGLCKSPLGLAHLAAAALESGLAEVLVHNADFHPTPAPFSIPELVGEGFAAYRRALDSGLDPAFDEVERIAAEFKPDLVGVAVRTPLLASARIAAGRVRRAVPEAALVAGGPHATLDPESLLAGPEFDAAAIGEGEATLVALLARLAEARPGRTRLPTDEPGLWVRVGDRIAINPPRPPIADLDGLPFPGALPTANLVRGREHPPQAFGYVFSSRGCPGRCAYCSSRSVWGGRVRFRSSRSTIAELAALAKRGVKHVHFDDDTFGGSKHRLVELCRDIARAGLPLSLGCETQVRLIDERTVAALAEAGFSTVQIGIESGDDAMLSAVGKGFTVARAERAAALVKAAGMRLETFFMVGFPDETEASLAATRALMERIPADKLIYSVFTPYPGTPLYDQCRRQGLVGPDYDPSRHNHQSPENAFCPNIPQARFRELAGAIEAAAAARNAARGR